MSKSNKNNFKIEWLYKPFTAPFVEIFIGYKHRIIPMDKIAIFTSLIALLLYFSADEFLFKAFGIQSFYPYDRPVTYKLMIYFFALTPLFSWAWLRVLLKAQLVSELSNIFINAEIKNARSFLPHFLRDVPIDTHCRKMTLRSNYVAIEKFRNGKSALQTGLGVYIDSINEKLENGTTEIIYSHSAMPEIYNYPKEEKARNYKFLIGKNRAFSSVYFDLKKTPHLLVAGETGSGKSYFLKQMLYSLYANHLNSTFIIIDLKGAADFDHFLGLPRVTIHKDPKESVLSFAKITQEVEKRKKLLSKYNCSNIDDLIKKLSYTDNDEEDLHLDRLIIVLDEAAELFLTGGKRKADMLQAQESRKAFSFIARQGRSLGIHLIISTQRPDKTALDTQVKTNLGGVLCFFMNDVAGSVSALGNKRATEMNKIKGRAIWKYGSDMQEVQTPFLKDEDLTELLEEFKVDIVDVTPDDEAKESNQSNLKENQNSVADNAFGGDNA